MLLVTPSEWVRLEVEAPPALHPGGPLPHMAGAPLDSTLPRPRGRREAPPLSTPLPGPAVRSPAPAREASCPRAPLRTCTCWRVEHQAIRAASVGSCSQGARQNARRPAQSDFPAVSLDFPRPVWILPPLPASALASRSTLWIWQPWVGWPPGGHGGRMPKNQAGRRKRECPSGSDLLLVPSICGCA